MNAECRGQWIDAIWGLDQHRANYGGMQQLLTNLRLAGIFRGHSWYEVESIRKASKASMLKHLCCCLLLHSLCSYWPVSPFTTITRDTGGMPQNWSGGSRNGHLTAAVSRCCRPFVFRVMISMAKNHFGPRLWGGTAADRHLWCRKAWDLEK